MEITRAGSQPSAKGPGDWFTGTVRIDPLFQTPSPARVAGAAVTFEPGCWGGPIEEIRPGDVVWLAPGEKHWHGASPTTAMTHIAVQEQLDGKAVD
jgi:quercetin dioxygenase-like cupin family protein